MLSSEKDLIKDIYKRLLREKAPGKKTMKELKQFICGNEKLDAEETETCNLEAIYEILFGKKAPGKMMMETERGYKKELVNAINNEKPITDEERPICDLDYDYDEIEALKRLKKKKKPSLENKYNN